MTPEPESIEEELWKSLGPWLNTRGFEQERHAFNRKCDSFEQRICPMLNRFRGEKEFHLYFILSITIYGIENLLRKYRQKCPSWRKRPLNDTRTMTLRLNNICPYLCPHEECTWSFLQALDVPDAAPEIITALDTIALPYLNTLSSEDRLAREIELWCTGAKSLPLGPVLENYGEILLAIYILHGQRKKFIDMVPNLRAAIAKCNGGYYLPTFDQIVSEMAADQNIAL